MCSVIGPDVANWSLAYSQYNAVTLFSEILRKTHDHMDSETWQACLHTLKGFLGHHERGSDPLTHFGHLDESDAVDRDIVALVKQFQEIVNFLDNCVCTQSSRPATPAPMVSTSGSLVSPAAPVVAAVTAVGVPPAVVASSSPAVVQCVFSSDAAISPAVSVPNATPDVMVSVMDPLPPNVVSSCALAAWAGGPRISGNGECRGDLAANDAIPVVSDLLDEGRQLQMMMKTKEKKLSMTMSPSTSSGKGKGRGKSKAKTATPTGCKSLTFKSKSNSKGSKSPSAPGSTSAPSSKSKSKTQATTNSTLCIDTRIDTPAPSLRPSESPTPALSLTSSPTPTRFFHAHSVEGDGPKTTENGDSDLE